MLLFTQLSYDNVYGSAPRTTEPSPENSTSADMSTQMTGSVPSMTYGTTGGYAHTGNGMYLNPNAPTHGYNTQRFPSKSMDSYESKNKTFTYNSGGRQPRASWGPVPSMVSTQPDKGINRTHFVNSSSPMFVNGAGSVVTADEHKHSDTSSMANTINPVLTKSDPFQASTK